MRQKFKTVEFLVPFKRLWIDRVPGDRSTFVDWYADRLIADGTVRFVAAEDKDRTELPVTLGGI